MLFWYEEIWSLKKVGNPTSFLLFTTFWFFSIKRCKNFCECVEYIFINIILCKRNEDVRNRSFFNDKIVMLELKNIYNNAEMPIFYRIHSKGMCQRGIWLRICDESRAFKGVFVDSEKMEKQGDHFGRVWNAYWCIKTCSWICTKWICKRKLSCCG